MKFLITESKLKQFIQKKFGVDLTNRIMKIENYDSLPESFKLLYGPGIFNFYLNKYGPIYLISGNSENYLYQNQDYRKFIVNSYDEVVSQSELIEDLGIPYGMGLSIDDLINLYVEKD